MGLRKLWHCYRRNQLWIWFALLFLTAAAQFLFTVRHLDSTNSSEPLSSKDHVQSNSFGTIKTLSAKNPPQNPVEKSAADQDCIFRDSPLYRSIFVYPSPGEPEWKQLATAILSETGKAFPDSHRYPWQDIESRTRQKGEYHFRLKDARAVQYTTELLVRDLFTHPNSCLRTHDPETASLFYVPYLVSMEWHNGTQYPKSFDTSPYGQAIIDMIDYQQYSKWETVWGYSSKYWKRKNGADHILVMSEGCHGLSHPQSRSGHYIFIEAQKQLSPPIIIFKDTSKTFGQMYPKCAAKNLVIPAPNPDGRWFNGRIDYMAKVLAQNASMTVNSPAQLPQDPLQRPLAYYYKAGNHGSCRRLRQSLEATFECSPSQTLLKQKIQKKLLPKGYHFPHAFRHATFCPCPGGDTPNAKRYYDAVLAGCIPLVLSEDFVWPYSDEIPGAPVRIDPKRFSLRLDAKQFTLDEATTSKACQEDFTRTQARTRPSTIQTLVESFTTDEIKQLQQGVQEASRYFQWYEPSPDLPDNPLQEQIMPDGLAARILVEALADRANGQRWPACQEELRSKNPGKDNVHVFKC